MSGVKVRRPGQAATEKATPPQTERDFDMTPFDAIPTDKDVDESLEETFPCSDPPSWMSVRRVGSPK
jgi:hypothetical protein